MTIRSLSNTHRPAAKHAKHAKQASKPATSSVQPPFPIAHISMETHSTPLRPPPHNAHSTASQASTNSAFESIGRAANEAVRPSSTAKNRSIGHGVAVIVVKGIMALSDQTSGDTGDDTENKPISSQHVRKRDKIYNFFRSPSSERKVEKAQSSGPTHRGNSSSPLNCQYAGQWRD
ncbi:hypothetical protein BKA57DRAFT_442241 [Linnemannia elongata]|nr:hypothetical protein BKA57DRAFT_442241 [Linnemannia elongata]